MNGGTGATNVIPGEVEILFNFRFCTASTVESLKSRLLAILNKHDLEFSIEWEYSKPYITARGNLVDAVSAAIKEVMGIDAELSTSGGTSDGRFIADICKQVVELGPRNATIHKLNECVELEHIEPLREIYQRTLEKLLK